MIESIDDHEFNSIKESLVSSYRKFIDDLFELCKSPIEIVYFGKMLQFFLNGTISPDGFKYFSPIYDFDHDLGVFRCFGLRIDGDHVYEIDFNTKAKSISKNAKQWKLSITITPQEKVVIRKKIYYLDFGIYVRNILEEKQKPLKIAIECDGKNWHSSKEQKARDLIRTKDLNKLGWEVIRYSGSNINKFSDTDFQKEMNEIITYIEMHFNLNKLSSLEDLGVKNIKIVS